MQDRHITLFVPGLFGAEAVRCTSGALDGLALAHLERWLARSEQHSCVPGFMEALFLLFGISAVADQDLPVAEITRITDGVRGDGVWLRADPVHLKPDRDRLVMFDNCELLIQPQEAQQLVREFNAVFRDDGMELFAPHPLRWYLRLSQRPQVRTRPLNAVIGQDVDPNLPQGSQAMAWHRVMNEVQMIFHSSEVNRRRQLGGKPEINSLWFWGGGELVSCQSVPWTHVWSNEPLTQALASYSDVKVDGLPPTAAEWLALSTEGGQHLVVLDGAVKTGQFGDIEGWRNFIDAFVSEWVSELSSALGEQKIMSIRLVTDAGFEWRITARNQRRWWRRRRSLLSYVQ
ncbi:MAG: hypothetical protein HY272_08410 [Gammaproteobacteria bacterium]|nr:hypothetical protein [Gammaproteobacteria bacterium]